MILDAHAYSGESSHWTTRSVHGADPDGSEFEIMGMLPRSAWGAYERDAPVDPLDLAATVARVATVRTASVGTVPVGTEVADPS